MSLQACDAALAIDASPEIHALLNRLHTLSEEQELEASKATSSALSAKALRQENPPDIQAKFDNMMRNRFVALERDKCQFIYQLLRSKNTVNVVEAGTSFGVSTIYWALAVSQNTAGKAKVGKVIATEKEAEKAARAKEYWREAGVGVKERIDLRVGDILETLKEGVEEIDLLLLDIWTPLALPTLKLVKPRLRHGAVVITDNTISAADGYADLLKYLRSPENHFLTMTLPFTNGLEMSTYLPPL